MIRKLSGTTAVITGATSGIGRETALEFARTGASVVIAGRREKRLQQLVSEIESTGGQALGVVTDVAEQAQVDHLIESAVERFGRVGKDHSSDRALPTAGSRDGARCAGDQLL